ncbi:MAG: hypothetical protein ACK5WB_01765 [Phycisphaerales bacterium]|jgi:hypothetical protein|nr:hypothetical protein [Phycisphaeraceae bacterium]
MNRHVAHPVQLDRPALRTLGLTLPLVLICAGAPAAVASTPLMTLESYERRVTGGASMRIGAITIPATPVSIIETNPGAPPLTGSLSGVFNFDGAAVTVCHQSQIISLSPPAEVSPGLWRLSCIARSSCSPSMSVNVANPSPEFSAATSLDMITQLTFRVALAERSVLDLDLLDELAAEQLLSPADVGSVDGVLTSVCTFSTVAGTIATATFERPIIGSVTQPPFTLSSQTTDRAWHLRPGTYDLRWTGRVTGSALARGGVITGPRRATGAGRVLGVLNLSAAQTGSPSADIATTDGEPGGDGVIDNGDFSLFFLAFFGDATDPSRLWADIANTDGAATPDGVVDNGDFTRFFADFFAPV